MSHDHIIRANATELDPDLVNLLAQEEKRQQETIILVASESEAPAAVRELMSSTFGNIYAEGYPSEASRRQSEADILDLPAALAHYRRYSDPRYYKGVEYADVLEALTRRRAAELFAANSLKPDSLFVNVQPLSGAPANSAVYTALLQPGDAIMGLNLNDGGHLSHGSKVNRSGKIYRSVPYFVDENGRLDYTAIEQIALAEKPQIIVAGFSAYPFIIDWQKFRDIADKVGAYLLADIAHISGLVASGVHPSPIGIADVVSTTTHKSLCGPRGAMILTHRRDLARKLDRAVFPGEQGGPHLNTMAALALALKLANSDDFRALQQRIVANAARLADQLQQRGLRIVGGGSENHLLLIDCKTIEANGVTLSGDMAARILDVAGIVLNRNTIPGDKGALNPSGLRLGTVWISQLGFGDAEIDQLAEAIATVLHGCTPFAYVGMGNKPQPRAKVSFAALQKARAIVRNLRGVSQPEPTASTLLLRGADASRFLQLAVTGDVAGLTAGEALETELLIHDETHRVTVSLLENGRFTLQFTTPQTAQLAQTWLQDLSDGYIQFADLYAKLPGAIVVEPITQSPNYPITQSPPSLKPYFVGGSAVGGEQLPAFEWQPPVDPPLLQTNLHATHKALGGRMVPFAGYDMPVWYSSVSEEHAAVREAAGLFDVSHMGVFDVQGVHAADFLDTVLTNDVHALRNGRSHYTYLLAPDGRVIDDLLLYRLATDHFMLVVNAANNDEDWAWLNAVNEGRVQLDPERPSVKIPHPVTLRDLRDPQHGDDQRVDIALQGPAAADALLAMGTDDATAKKIRALPWAGLLRATVGGYDLIVSRTGYTGERVAYELFVHPDRVVDFWNDLLAAGEALGVKPCGLAARDSTRTEAGLPLHGHELAGPLALSPAEAGFGSYLKLWKPFFVGRAPFIQALENQTQQVVRFRMNDKGVRRAELGDPVLDRRGKIIGTVTSCAIDSEGYLLGQAVLPLDMQDEGTAVYIYQLGGGKRKLPTATSLNLGKRLPIPDAATILSRFPKR